MAKILLIETATTVSSVAVSVDGHCAHVEHSGHANRHAEDLLQMVEKVFASTGLQYSELNAIAVSAGPGSYTGLRIGVSLAKGLCYASEIPLLAISTLEIMAMGTIRRNPHHKGYVCPMIDARRMEVYSAVFNHKGQRISDDLPLIFDDGYTWPFSDAGSVCFTGNGVQKAMVFLSQVPQSCYEPEGVPDAEYMAALAETKFQLKRFEDLAWFEPAYLKPFQSKHS